MKKGKKKKIVIFSILGIIICFCAIVGYYVVKDLREESKLRENINEINTLISADDMDVNKINNKLKTYVTSGENLSLETAVKAYYMDAFNLVLDLKDIVNDERITNILSTENLKNDAPDFSYSTSYISNTNENISKSIEEVKEFLSNKNVMSYYKKAGLDSYYKDLYIELTSMFNYFGNATGYEKDMNKLINQLNAISEVLTFLPDNRNNWTILNDVIYFNDNALLEQFKTLISRVDYKDKNLNEY